MTSGICTCYIVRPIGGTFELKEGVKTHLAFKSVDASDSVGVLSFLLSLTCDPAHQHNTGLHQKGELFITAILDNLVFLCIYL